MAEKTVEKLKKQIALLRILYKEQKQQLLRLEKKQQEVIRAVVRKSDAKKIAHITGNIQTL